MANVKKGDTVLVLAGKDRGKRGTVERVERIKRGLGVVVPGINMAKKHQRSQTRTQQGRTQGFHHDASSRAGRPLPVARA